MPQQPLRIAYVWESRQQYQSRGYSFEQCCELTDDGTTAAIISALESLGHTVEKVGDIQSLVKAIAIADHEGSFGKWDLVYNGCEGFIGTTRQSQVPGLLEAYDIPFTFSSAQSIMSCINKGLAKMTMDLYGVPTAPFAIVPHLDYSTNGIETKKYTMAAIEQSKHSAKILNSFPLFIKPVSEGTSKGITKASKINSIDELEQNVENLFDRYPGQDILIETFLSGREFTIGIIGTGDKAKVIGAWEYCWHARHTVNVAESQDTLGMSRVKLTPGDMVDFLTHDLKTGRGTKGFQSAADPNDPEVKRSCEIAIQAWRLFKCRDMGRVDVRSDKFGPDAVPCIIEVNPLTGIIPDGSAFCFIAKNAGLSYQDIIEAVIDSALERMPDN
ncbi:hypothetical protein ABW20_dc0103421 [Dactylellina cionopaga]|nr:hypothetical protein ABW20_dc0103421 [Dactylellina cionopaga]